MSEENEASEERVAEDVKNLLKQGKKTITVKHIFKDERRQQSQVVDDDAEGDDGSELGETKKKLQEREAQLAALALKDFNDKKAALLSQIEDEDERARLDEYIGDDPDNYKTVKALKGVSVGDEDDGSETPPPKGKVRRLGAQGTTQAPDANRKYQNQTINMISDLFGILKDPKKTQEEKAVANQKIDDLYLEIAKGRKNNPNFKTISGGSIMTCPNCGHAVEGVNLDEGDTCPYCGWKQDGVKTREIRYDYTMKPK